MSEGPPTHNQLGETPDSMIVVQDPDSPTLSTQPQVGEGHPIAPSRHGSMLESTGAQQSKRVR